jgi:hypothetical protein
MSLLQQAESMENKASGRPGRFADASSRRPLDKEIP